MQKPVKWWKVHVEPSWTASTLKLAFVYWWDWCPISQYCVEWLQPWMLCLFQPIDFRKNRPTLTARSPLLELKLFHTTNLTLSYFSTRPYKHSFPTLIHLFGSEVVVGFVVTCVKYVSFFYSFPCLLTLSSIECGHFFLLSCLLPTYLFWMARSKLQFVLTKRRFFLKPLRLSLTFSFAVVGCLSIIHEPGLRMIGRLGEVFHFHRFVVLGLSHFRRQKS